MSAAGPLTSLLASYVPGIVQKRIMEDPAPLDGPFAEEFPAIVMLADISGFTSLSERLAEKGPAGVETLAGILNDYFGRLIDIIYEYGGDVVKFAGDALIAVWSIPAEPGDGGLPSEETMRQWTLHAAECAGRIRTQMLDHRAEGIALSLKLVLASGRIQQIHLGGFLDRWHFMLVGDPIVEIGALNHLAAAGDIILGPSAFRSIERDCDALPLPFALEGKDNVAARLANLKSRSGLSLERPRLVLPEEAQAWLRPYISEAILGRIAAGQSDWLAELRKVTVVFINLPRLGQDTTLETAQELVQVLQRSVFRLGGSINKITQDDKGVMIDAAYGLPPLAHVDDAARGVQLAMLLRAEMQARQLQGSIGIATGRVFCGLVGNDQRRQYTFVGSSINLAARLMSLAGSQPGLVERDNIGILCDRATYDGAREQVEFMERPSQSVKGRSEPVEVFYPLRARARVVRPQKGLTGRQEERAILLDAMDRLQSGDEGFQAIVLQGEPGIGKSRLMRELVEQAQAAGIRTFAGATDAMEKSSSYFAWRTVFNRVFGIEQVVAKQPLEDADRDAIRRAVTAKLDAIEPELVRAAPLLSPLLPMLIPDNELTAAMTGEVRGGNTRDLLVRLLQYEAAGSPMLVALEDLHWLDSASWTLLADVFQKVRPLLLAVSTRPLGTPVPAQFEELTSRSDARLIKLDMLGLDEVEQLVCQKLGVVSLPPDIAELIRRRSEGHPFFAEELAYALRDTGLLVIDGQDCRVAPDVARVNDIILPDNLEAAITSRIDGLDPSQQLALKVASVIGRLFLYRMLEAVHPIESDRELLPGYMTALSRINLILVESAAPDLAYLFKHALTQEVAYNLMLFSQRGQLHQAVAEWIEQNHSRDIETYLTVLAYHWTRAADTAQASERELVVSKAIEYLEKAGDQSLTNFANAEAIQFFHDALRLSGQVKVSNLRLGQWHRKISDAYLGLGKLAEAKASLLDALRLFGAPLPGSDAGLIGVILKEAARQTAHRLRPPRLVGSALLLEEETRRMEIVHLAYQLSVLQFLNGDPNPLPMLYAVLLGLNVAETMKATPQLWTMFAAMSALMGFVPLHSQAQYYKSRWFSLGEKFDDPNLFVDGASALCAVASGNGEWQEVKELVERASAICEELGDHRRGAEVVAYVAVNALMEAGPKLAAPYNQREWEIAMRRENPIHIAFAYQVDCSAMVWSGDFDGCIENARKCLALSEKSWVGEIPDYIVRSAMWLALWLKGEREGVWGSVKAALDKFSKASVVDFSAYLIHSHLAEVAFLALVQARDAGWSDSQRKEIEKYARIALGTLKKYAGIFAIGVPALHRYTGLLEWVHGHPEKAYQHWRKAAQAAARIPMSYEAGRAELLLAEHLPADHPEKAEYLRKAVETFASSGYDNWAAVAEGQPGLAP